MSLTTLANLKQWLNTTTTNDDALMTRLIVAASYFMESWLNRTILQGSYLEIYDGTNFDTLTLRNYPITSVAYVMLGGVNQKILAANDFTSQGIGFTPDGQLYGQFMKFDKGRQNIAVSYTAGFATVPPDIEQACIELCALKYKNLRGDRLGITSKGLAGESVGFFIGDMTPSVKTLLNQYRNVAPV